MAVRWGGLRPDPYDPNARDADGDGIVQEGTAWERPYGSQIISEIGDAIMSGRTATQRPRGLRIIGGDGQPIDYTPTYMRPGARLPGAPEVPTEGPGVEKWRDRHMGVPSLKERGLPSLSQIVHGPDSDRTETARSTPRLPGGVLDNPETIGGVGIADASITPAKKISEYDLSEAVSAFPELFDPTKSETEIIRDILPTYGFEPYGPDANHLTNQINEWRLQNAGAVLDANSELIQEHRALYEELVASQQLSRSSEKKFNKLPPERQIVLRELAGLQQHFDFQKGVLEEAEGQREVFSDKLTAASSRLSEAREGTTVPISATKITESVQLSSQNAEIERMLSVLDDIHGLDPDGGAYTSPVLVEDVDGNQGVFYPEGFNGESSRIYVDPLDKTIEDQEFAEANHLMTFVHEFGHRVDFYTGPDGQPRSYVEQGLLYGSPAVTELFETLRTSQWWAQFEVGMLELKATQPGAGFDYATWLSSPVEIWARLYTQYVAERAEDERLRSVIRNDVAGHPMGRWEQWDDASFAPLYPLVEAVLRERKMIT